MSELQIVTNNHINTFLYGYELPDKVKPDFNYLEDIDSCNFIKYKNIYYDLSEFMRIENNSDLAGWDGYSSDSFFSGVLIKLIDSDTYKIATYYS